jgi:hypothetical protein
METLFRSKTTLHFPPPLSAAISVLSIAVACAAQKASAQPGHSDLRSARHVVGIGGGYTPLYAKDHFSRATYYSISVFYSWRPTPWLGLGAIVHQQEATLAAGLAIDAHLTFEAFQLSAGLMGGPAFFIWDPQYVQGAGPHIELRVSAYRRLVEDIDVGLEIAAFYERFTLNAPPFSDSFTLIGGIPARLMVRLRF